MTYFRDFFRLAAPKVIFVDRNMLPYTVCVALKTDSNAPGNASRHLSEERLVQMNEEKPNSNYQDPPLCEAH